MNASTKPRGISLINVLLFIFKVIRVMIWIATVLLVVMVVLSIITSFDPDAKLPIEMPVFFSLEEQPGIINWADGSQGDFKIKGGLGLAQIEPPLSLMLLYLLDAGVGLLLIFLSIRYTIRILRSVKAGDFLVMENAIRLRWIALLSIGVFLVDKIGMVTMSAILSKKLVLEGFQFKALNSFSFLESGNFLTSLFLLVIAEVVKKGAEVKAEHDLTV